MKYTIIRKEEAEAEAEAKTNTNAGMVKKGNDLTKPLLNSAPESCKKLEHQNQLKK